jgi:two-component system phosphate regulon sensor histidine kinase PhoR
MSFLNSWLPKKKTPTDNPFALFEILKTMREAVIIVGEDTRILASNPASYQAFARGNGALEQKRLTEVIRDLSVHEAFRRALDENVVTEVEFEFITGEKRTFAVRVSPLQLEETRNAVGIFYDLTQIERLETIRQEFLSNVSHELRTPLTSILAFVETLEDGAIEDQANNRRFLGVIRKNARRMHRLIDDILELSSIEAGKISVQSKRVNLSALVNEVFTNLSAKAGEKGIRLENTIAADTCVYADAIRLEQILTNLVDNAVKFNRAEGSVTVAHEQKDGRDSIRVIDTGEGIAGEHLQRIFERFYRADRARSSEVGGTGLGLAIVKHLARLHGGEVSATSVIGKGSIFVLELQPAPSPDKVSSKNLS